MPAEIINPILKKNRSGRWEIRFTERPENENGRWQTRTVSARTRVLSEAQDFLKKFVEAERILTKKAERLTITDLVAKYKTAIAERGGSSAQDFSLKRILKHFGPSYPENIDLTMVNDYKQLRFRDVAPSTVRRELSALIAVLNYATKHRLIEPGDAPVIDLPPAAPPKDLFLTEEQEAEYHALAMGDSIGRKKLSRVSIFVALGLDTAARKSAILGLTWDRVDMDRLTIDYRDPNRRATKKRRVAVPICDRLLPILQRARAEADNDYVCGRGDIVTTFKRFRQGSGYDWVTPHVLRHTWATLAARRSVPMWEIAGVLGDDEATVRKNYLHHCPDHLRDAVNRIC